MEARQKLDHFKTDKKEFIYRIKKFFDKFPKGLNTLTKKIIEGYKLKLIENQSLQNIYDFLNQEVVVRRKNLEILDENLLNNIDNRNQLFLKDFVEKEKEENNQNGLSNFNTLQFAIDETAIENMSQIVESYQKSIFFIYFAILTIIKKICDLVSRASNLSNTTNFLTDFVSNLLSKKLAGVNFLNFSQNNLNKTSSNDSYNKGSSNTLLTQNTDVGGKVSYEFFFYIYIYSLNLI